MIGLVLVRYEKKTKAAKGEKKWRLKFKETPDEYVRWNKDTIHHSQLAI